MFSEKELAEPKKSNRSGKTVDIKAFHEKELEELVKKQQEQAREKKDKRAQAKKSIAEIMPIIDMTDDGLFELRDRQGYFDIWQIEGKDIYQMNNEETQFDVFTLAHFYQAYEYPIKIVSLNFPVSTESQQQFVQKKIEESDNALYDSFLLRKQKELQYLEWGRTNREYYMFIFGESELVVKEHIESARRPLQRSMTLLPVAKEKKLEIVYKLNNQNAKLGQKNY